MGSKVIVFFGLFLAVVFLISSEVGQVAAARQLDDATTIVDAPKEVEVKNEAAVNDATYETQQAGRLRCLFCRCCNGSAEKVDAEHQAKPRI